MFMVHAPQLHYLCLLPMVEWAEMDVLYVAAIYVCTNASINTHCNGYRLGIWLCFVPASVCNLQPPTNAVYTPYGLARKFIFFSTLNGDVRLSDKIVMVRIIKSVRKVLINGHCIITHARTGATIQTCQHTHLPPVMGLKTCWFLTQL